MEIIMLGTGAAWPDADRSAPAFLVRNNQLNYLIDCGGGASHQLMKAGMPPSRLQNILFTHMHIDHCVEFPSLVFGAYLTGKEGGFSVFGPKGTQHFTKSIFNDTYDFAAPMLKKLRNKDIDITTTEIESGRVLECNGLIIEAAPVEHGIPSLAYKFKSNGKVVVFSGDTAPCSSITEFSRNVDLLVVECSFPESVGPKPGHLIPSQVAKLAIDANVKALCLVHLFPTCKGKEHEILDEITRVYSGPVEIGQDLQVIII